jgi:hypothetical protein
MSFSFAAVALLIASVNTNSSALEVNVKFGEEVVRVQSTQLYDCVNGSNIDKFTPMLCGFATIKDGDITIEKTGETIHMVLYRDRQPGYEVIEVNEKTRIGTYTKVLLSGENITCGNEMCTTAEGTVPRYSTLPATIVVDKVPMTNN